ncbi:TRAP transporter small permease subunit [Novosphingobium umbonatum]|uniref:TRAP transporter small permease protein n=1 Tax=Novosphingobium umbonatum TaxID=1908524 RepID=A0A3S2V7W2_9SPHN|nr:TRAP transporter small permease subunit [Novosphingobium umbonatum]RVU05883.1 TRAP transporter small permease subunit [Novosphingobium umbonatum]
MRPAEETKRPESGARRLLRNAAYAMGATGLGLGAASDGIAVAGRHLGLHLLGSIEITQGAIVLLGAGGMLYATLEGHHASVHMVTQRLSQATSARLARVMAGVSALVFLAIAAGSIWLGAEMWGGFEQTELLHIPIRWLRALWEMVALAIAALFARQALFGNAGEQP